MQQTELILNDDGSIYHLRLFPGELASKLILVGDPDRVDKVGVLMDRVELRRQKREFHTLTGWYGGERISVMSTGIGTDNIDIVLHEIDALFNLDFGSRTIKPQTSRLQILRLGTCGGLQPEIPVGTIVSSAWAVGGDGLLPYYRLPVWDAPFQDALHRFWEGENGPLPLYHSPADESLSTLIAERFPEIQSGITFTAAGFYGPQGRSLGRLAIKMPRLADALRHFRYQDRRFVNMEMEAAAIMALGKALGHRCGTLAVILANRQMDQFAADPKAEEHKLITTGLEVLRQWQ